VLLYARIKVHLYALSFALEKLVKSRYNTLLSLSYELFPFLLTCTLQTA